MLYYLCGGTEMMSFVLGMVIGIFVGVVCMALFTAASWADEKAEQLTGSKHTLSEK